MNVIIINDSSSVTGGADYVAIHSAVGLAKNGCNVFFFSGFGSPDPLLTSTPGISLISLNQSDLLSDRFRLRAAVRGIWNLTSRRALRKLLRGTSPCNTVVHIHSWTKCLSSSIFPVLFQYGFLPVLTLHDYFSACPNGAFLDYANSLICKRKALGVKCVLHNCDRRHYAHKIWRCIRGKVQTLVGMPNRIRHFISLSDLSEDVLKDYLSADSEVYRVENPCDISKGDRVKAELNQSIVFVGRLAQEKAPHHLALSAAQVGIPITFIGSGDMEDEIRKINASAVLTGWKSKAEVIELLRSARSLILPSVWYETYGLVVREAQSMGVPVVVSDLCAARELVKKSEGIIFKGGDIQDLSQKLAQLADDNLIEGMSKASYFSYWSKPNTIVRHANELVNIYAKILKRQVAELC